MTHDPERLSELLRASRALPRDVEPPADVWTGIRARITTRRRPARRRLAPWLAAAAAAAVVLVAGAAVLRNAAGRRAVTPPPAPVTTAAAVRDVERQYATTIAELDATLQAGRETFAPSTARVVDRSLAEIDTAIAETREALQSDPANDALVGILSSHYERKVDLLQRATELATSF